MTMTTPACPLQPFFQQAVPAAVKKATGRDAVRLNITFDPVWTPEKMTEKGKMFMRMMR
jgi:metal-sulfur cluster biosynthetic enzyme